MGGGLIMTVDAAGRASHDDAEVAQQALEAVRKYLSSHPSTPAVIELVSDDAEGEHLLVPRSAVELLARILTYMSSGDAVSVVPNHAQLTTQQAADVLNVSRPYLIKLLDHEQIEYTKVGKHRRIKASSLLEYKRQDDLKRREAADELSALSQELGLV
ncbi:excisionase family DNA-binding protein [Kineococcus sp. LSe6-4]|uniref:Excisionase family DNA-binding protein n=2 Tax=Kineococcus halophytocola TaxID=3234027 RepID=A0ABV4GYL7_9ACTN